MYCNDMELSEGQDAAWCTIRSFLNPKSASYNYPTLLVSTGGIKTRSVATTEKLERVFTNEIENNVFDEEVKTDIDAELPEQG